MKLEHKVFRLLTSKQERKRVICRVLRLPLAWGVGGVGGGGVSGRNKLNGKFREPLLAVPVPRTQFIAVTG